MNKKGLSAYFNTYSWFCFSDINAPHCWTFIKRHNKIVFFSWIALLFSIKHLSAICHCIHHSPVSFFNKVLLFAVVHFPGIIFPFQGKVLVYCSFSNLLIWFYRLIHWGCLSFLPILLYGLCITWFLLFYATLSYFTLQLFPTDLTFSCPHPLYGYV